MSCVSIINSGLGRKKEEKISNYRQQNTYNEEVWIDRGVRPVTPLRPVPGSEALNDGTVLVTEPTLPKWCAVDGF